MLRLVLLGFGSVNQVLVDILQRKKEELRVLLRRNVLVVAASDSKGAIYNRNGLNLDRLTATKKQSKSVIYYSDRDSDSRSSAVYVDALTLLRDQRVEYDILIDASPVNLQSGEPGLACCLHALQGGKKVVLANKAPLVLQFKQLHKYEENLRYSAAVCGGLPVVNVLKHDLMVKNVSTVKELSGIFNSTSNYMLTQLTNHVDDDSVSMESALKHAQDLGIAETDPSLDINGSDTANKLCIIERSGLEKVNKAMIVEAATNENKVYKMIARATKLKSDDGENETWKLSVHCEKVDKNSFLGSTRNTDNSLQIETDLFDTQFYKTNEKDVVGTSAAVLRDIVALTLNDKNYSLSKL